MNAVDLLIGKVTRLEGKDHVISKVKQYPMKKEGDAHEKLYFEIVLNDGQLTWFPEKLIEIEIVGTKQEAGDIYRAINKRKPFRFRSDEKETVRTIIGTQMQSSTKEGSELEFECVVFTDDKHFMTIDCISKLTGKEVKVTQNMLDVIFI